jgi:hypothetical protein
MGDTKEGVRNGKYINSRIAVLSNGKPIMRQELKMSYSMENISCMHQILPFLQMML